MFPRYLVSVFLIFVLVGCEDPADEVDCSSLYEPDVINGLLDAGLENCPIDFDERITLTSRGGDYSAAVQIANKIKLHDTDTRARHYCASACTFLFISGGNRQICDDATLGFHQPRDEEYIDEVIDFYAQESRLEQTVLRAIIETTPYEDIFIVLPEDAVAFGMADEVVNCGMDNE